MTGKLRHNKIKDQFPILGIHEFQFDLESDYSLLYHSSQGRNFIEKPHKHDFFLLFLIEKGTGMHSIDFIDHKVKDSQIHILFPGQVHKWDLGENTSGFQLMISRRVFEKLTTSLRFSFILYQNHPVINLNSKTFTALLYEFQSIQKELEMQPVDWDIVYTRNKLIVQLVGREAERKFKDITIYSTKPALLKYYALVDAHFKEQKSVSFYAGKLNISANYLNILCKRHFNVPAMFFIQNRLMLEAKRLIQASEKSIKEIAFELGFDDFAYFSNFFKKQAGISPREFREQL